MRSAAISSVVFALVVVGCGDSGPGPKKPEGAGGVSGLGGSAAHGGGGQGGKDVLTGRGGAPNGSGGRNIGGTGGTSSAASGSDASLDTPTQEVAGSGPADGPSSTDTSSAAILDVGANRDWPALKQAPWVIPCPDYTNLAQCCAHYCDCMAINCAQQLPTDCLSKCAAPNNGWHLKCRVEQCFESLNPGFPQDRGSHCGHAVESPQYGTKCQY